MKEVHVRETFDEENAAKMQFYTRNSVQRALGVTQIPVTPVRLQVRFQLEEPPIRLLCFTSSTTPRPHYYLPQLAEVIECHADAESLTTTFSVDISENGYCSHTTLHPGPDEISTAPVNIPAMRLRST